VVLLCLRKHKRGRKKRRASSFLLTLAAGRHREKRMGLRGLSLRSYSSVWLEGGREKKKMGLDGLSCVPRRRVRKTITYRQGRTLRRIFSSKQEGGGRGPACFFLLLRGRQRKFCAGGGSTSFACCRCPCSSTKKEKGGVSLPSVLLATAQGSGRLRSTRAVGILRQRYLARKKKKKGRHDLALVAAMGGGNRSFPKKG